MKLNSPMVVESLAGGMDGHFEPEFRRFVLGAVPPESEDGAALGHAAAGGWDLRDLALGDAVCHRRADQAPRHAVTIGLWLNTAIRVHHRHQFADRPARRAAVQQP